MDGLADSRLRRVRFKTMAWLMATTGLGSVGLVAGYSIANVAGAGIRERNDWTSGLPGMMVLLGSAFASVPLSEYMSRHGRRPGLMIGYTAAAFGALLAVVAELNRSFLLLLPAMGLLGFGITSNALSRYAASDVASATQRGKFISLVAWCSVIGGIAAPNLIGRLSDLSQRMGMPELVGSFGLASLTCLVAVLILHVGLRPDPIKISQQMSQKDFDLDASNVIRSRREIMGIPAVQVAVTALVVGQLVMVMIMSMTALHMRSNHHDWGVVGLVISGHIGGMYALAPLTGWACDRFGRSILIVTGGMIVLVAAVLAGTRPLDQTSLAFALFLLGLGWNCSYVAGSALLTDAVALSERTTAQGFADFATGLVSAFSSLVAGLVYSGFGFAPLALTGGILILIPTVLVAVRRTALRRPVPQAIA